MNTAWLHMFNFGLHCSLLHQTLSACCHYWGSHVVVLGQKAPSYVDCGSDLSLLQWPKRLHQHRHAATGASSSSGSPTRKWDGQVCTTSSTQFQDSCHVQPTNLATPFLLPNMLAPAACRNARRYFTSKSTTGTSAVLREPVPTTMYKDLRLGIRSDLCFSISNNSESSRPCQCKCPSRCNLASIVALHSILLIDSLRERIPTPSFLGNLLLILLDKEGKGWSPSLASVGTQVESAAVALLVLALFKEDRFVSLFQCMLSCGQWTSNTEAKASKAQRPGSTLKGLFDRIAEGAIA